MREDPYWAGSDLAEALEHENEEEARAILRERAGAIPLREWEYPYYGCPLWESLLRKGSVQALEAALEGKLDLKAMNDSLKLPWWFVILREEKFTDDEWEKYPDAIRKIALLLDHGSDISPVLEPQNQAWRGTLLDRVIGDLSRRIELSHCLDALKALEKSARRQGHTYTRHPSGLVPQPLVHQLAQFDGYPVNSKMAGSPALRMQEGLSWHLLEQGADMTDLFYRVRHLSPAENETPEEDTARVQKYFITVLKSLARRNALVPLLRRQSPLVEEGSVTKPFQVLLGAGLLPQFWNAYQVEGRHEEIRAALALAEPYWQERYALLTATPPTYLRRIETIDQSTALAEWVRGGVE